MFLKDVRIGSYVRVKSYTFAGDVFKVIDTDGEKYGHPPVKCVFVKGKEKHSRKLWFFSACDLEVVEEPK